jgi:16S rRNA (guanine527-N7)-methyltransferase
VKQPEPFCTAPTEFEPRLRELVEFIRTAAKSQNLVSPGDLEHLWERHILDSLAPLLWSEELGLNQAGTWVDMGAGAGFPVLPLAICLPHWTFYAIEPRRLRVLHLELAAETLGLGNMKVVGAKAESSAKLPAFSEVADIVSSRAVGKIPEDAQRALPFLNRRGWFVTFKHNEQVQGIDGYHPLSYVRYRLPQGDEPRTLVLAPISSI